MAKRLFMLVPLTYFAQILNISIYSVHLCFDGNIAQTKHTVSYWQMFNEQFIAIHLKGYNLWKPEFGFLSL